MRLAICSGGGTGDCDDEYSYVKRKLSCDGFTICFDRVLPNCSTAGDFPGVAKYVFDSNAFYIYKETLNSAKIVNTERLRNIYLLRFSFSSLHHTR